MTRALASSLLRLADSNAAATRALNAALDACEIRVGVTAAFQFEADTTDDAIELCMWSCADGLLVAAGLGDQAGEPVRVWRMDAAETVAIGEALLAALEIWSGEAAEMIDRVLGRQEAA